MTNSAAFSAYPQADTVSRELADFPHALGVALVPDSATKADVLSVTDEIFQRVDVKDGIRLSEAKLPHVSLFQNLFRDPDDLVAVLEEGLVQYPLSAAYEIQPEPNDVTVWAGDRPFLNIEVAPELAHLHDYLLVECIVRGRNTLCAGRPADKRPLLGLSSEQDRAYRETGYVFAGAGTAIASAAGAPWRAFTIPHFTLGIVDWSASAPGGPGVATSRELIELARTIMRERGFTACLFEKIVVFRVQPGGVYVPSFETTVWERRLR